MPANGHEVDLTFVLSKGSFSFYNTNTASEKLPPPNRSLPPPLDCLRYLCSVNCSKNFGGLFLRARFDVGFGGFLVDDRGLALYYYFSVRSGYKYIYICATAYIYPYTVGGQTVGSYFSVVTPRRRKRCCHPYYALAPQAL